MLNRTHLLSFLLLLIFCTAVNAQEKRILSLDDYTYEYIKRLQNRGEMLSLNPTSLPYTYGEVSEALKTIAQENLNSSEKVWVEFIKERIELNEASENEKNPMGIELVFGTRLSDTERLDVLRPLNQEIYAYPYASLSGYMERSNFVGQLSVRHDYYYDQDPDGIDAARRLFTRGEESYIGYDNDLVKIRLGRFYNHWGRYDEASSVLSTNARSFDQLNISIGGKYVSFQSIIGELDAISENDTFTGNAYTEGSKKRYVAMHRFNWRPSEKFGTSFFGSVIYSGVNSGLSLKYANPLLFYGFVTDNYPKNDENNLLMGGMIWGNHRSFSFSSQLMLDDVHVFTDVEEPITFTFLSSFTYALDNPSIDINLEFESSAYHTYNAPQAEGRYLYLGRSIATPTNDYIKVKLSPDFYLDDYLRGLKATPYLSLYLQGEKNINEPHRIRKPNGELYDVILTGTEEKTFRGGINILYQPNSNFWFELDTGYNSLENYNHITGNSNSRWGTIFEAGFRVGLYEGN